MEYVSACGPLQLIEASCRSGGRGGVYDIVGQDGLVAKVLNPAHRTQRRKDKVRLLRQKLQGSSCKVAFPLDDLWDEKGNWAGYLMPKLGGQRLDCFLRTVDMSLERRVRIAYRLAKEVYKLHRRGIIVGDLALENCQVDPATGEVTIFDADGFQLYDLECGLFGSEEAHLKSPEMIENGGLDSSLGLSEKSDSFLLGSAVHELIFLRDPFSEYVPDTPREQTKAENVRILRYAYMHCDDALPLNTAGDDLALLFQRTFTTQDTPYVFQWVHALERIVSEGFKSCGCGWEYPNSRTACPNCGAGNSAAVLPKTAAAFAKEADARARKEARPRSGSAAGKAVSALKLLAGFVPVVLATILAVSLTYEAALYVAYGVFSEVDLPLVFGAVACWCAFRLAWSSFVDGSGKTFFASAVVVCVFFAMPDTCLLSCEFFFYELTGGCILPRLQEIALGLFS